MKLEPGCNNVCASLISSPSLLRQKRFYFVRREKRFNIVLVASGNLTNCLCRGPGVQSWLLPGVSFPLL